ncbi:substrate-binding periplasmic protein [Leeia oryzae]|uniref:substrate-binding periplasmic protein n=1 Tax=Leeia oryzae TaxID=356662 RepID=UPI00036DE57E|nr:transporter substrate-binding domain-containing protein [Leeia oryzae]
MRYWIALLIASLGLQAQALSLLTEDYPPFNYAEPNGHISGISTEIVQQLMRDAKLPYTITLLPWSRAISLTQVEADTCVFSMSRIPERELGYKWIGPLVSNDWILYGLKDAKPIMQLSDIERMRVGSYQGDAIIPWMHSRGYDVDVAPNDDVNPQKLLLKRIDYWATGKLIGQYRLKQQKLEDKIVPIMVFNRTSMYLACNRKVPDALVDRLNGLLQAMQKRGVVKSIYQKYGYQP